MAVMKNADGSITVGILVGEEKPNTGAKTDEKPKRGKAKTKGEG